MPSKWRAISLPDDTDPFSVPDAMSAGEEEPSYFPEKRVLCWRWSPNAPLQETSPSLRVSQGVFRVAQSQHYLLDEGVQGSHVGTILVGLNQPESSNVSFPRDRNVQSSRSIEDVIIVMERYGLRDIVDKIRKVCQFVEEEDDDEPVSLESLKNLAIFMLREAHGKPEANIGYYAEGVLSADWDVHEGLLSLIFLKDASIRLVITSTPAPIKEIPDVDKRRGTLTMHRDRIGCVFNCMFNAFSGLTTE